MSPTLLSAQFFFLSAAVLFLALGSLAGALVVRLARGPLVALPPHARHRVLSLLAATPPLVALVLLLAASLPSLQSLLTQSADHCSVHGESHAHFCFVHLPQVASLNAPLLAMVALALGLGLTRALRTLFGLLRGHRQLQSLSRTGQPLPQLEITVVESAQPVCLAAGLWRPRVLMSRPLFSSLSSRQLEVVLAHEREHVRRRDALWALGVRFCCAAFHLPPTARWLSAELDVAAEQSCDEAAASATHDRLLVAETILSLERKAGYFSPATLSALSVAFGQTAIARRVESLLAEPRDSHAAAHVLAVHLLLLLALVGAADFVHHTAESLLSLLLS